MERCKTTMKERKFFKNRVSEKVTFKSCMRSMIQNRYLYLLLAPAIIYLLVFDYRVMYGIQLAFKDYNAKLGIWGSPWIGFDHYVKMFADPYFLRVLFNTVKISFGSIIFTFPWAIIIALLFNELRQRHVKKVLQTVYTFPHFLSWVVVSGVIINFLGYLGPVNSVMDAVGLERHVFLGDTKLIIPILYITRIWKEAGWSSIVYMAAIAGIDDSYYEAADLDGASRWQKMWYITLPAIRGTILTMLTLQVGHILNAGFDQIFNLANMVTWETIDIIDTYIYRITFQQTPDFAYSTALGLFKSLVGILMVLVTNKVSKKIAGTGIIE